MTSPEALQPAIDILPAAALPTPAGVAVNQRTGEPRRPWSSWLGAALLLGAAGAATLGLAQAMWELASPIVLEGENYVKDDRFATATWLSGLWVTEPGSVARVALAVAVTLLGVGVVAVTGTVSFYAFRGYRWTRVGGLVAVAVSLTTLALNPTSWGAIPLAGLGAALLWVPATRRYDEAWTALRHPEPPRAEPLGQVCYGPLPRYR